MGGHHAQASIWSVSIAWLKCINNGCRPPVLQVLQLCHALLDDSIGQLDHVHVCCPLYGL